MLEKCKIVLDGTCSKLSYAAGIQVASGKKHPEKVAVLKYLSRQVQVTGRAEFLTNICLSIIGLNWFVRLSLFRIIFLSI